MAIVKKGNMYGQVGRLGQDVYYSVYGETRSRTLAAEVSNPRTQAQMSQRVRWANCVNIYRANQSWQKNAYETAKRNQSDYNKFMSLNVAGSNIYLTKQQAAAGACVVSPYIMSQGSLPSIECTPTTGGWQTNIYLPSSFVLSASTTVGEFATALLPLNPALREGDQLSFIRLTQMNNGVTGYPYVLVRKYEVLLTPTSTALLSDYWPVEYFSLIVGSSGQLLKVVDSGMAGGFLIILSRTLGGKTIVSTQQVILANMAATIAQYSAPAQLAEAIASYGESEEPFLSTVTAKQDAKIPVPVSIVQVNVGDDGVYMPGGYYDDLPNWAAQQIEITLNQDIEATSVSCVASFATMHTVQEGDPVDMEISGNVLTGITDSSWDGSLGGQLLSVTVIIDGQSIAAVFAVEPGLE